MEICVLLVAGGSGSRMQSQMPKQFLKLLDIPVFIRTLQTFAAALPLAKFVLVVPVESINVAQEILKNYTLPPVTLVAGGETRYQSVYNGLKACPECRFIMVHDAVRCLLTPGLIHHLLQVCQEKGNAIPVTDCTDTPRMIMPDGSNMAVDRSRLKMVQTPQVFEMKILREVMNQPWQPGFTDEASAAELSGYNIHLAEGEVTNLKITYPADLLLAKQILETRAEEESKV